jgi:hypothetical protein
MKNERGNKVDFTVKGIKQNKIDSEVPVKVQRLMWRVRKSRKQMSDVISEEKGKNLSNHWL